MKSYAKYIDKGTPEQYQRAFRETFLFQIINYFDSKYVPDSAEGVDGYEHSHLTFEQKCRLRNQIYAIANNHAKEQNTQVDANGLVSAFFETNYGKKYAAKRAEWEEGHEVRTANEQLARDWTTNQDGAGKGVRRFTISPYDPEFSNSDLFSDKNDEIGYFIVRMTDDGNRYLNERGEQVLVKSDVVRLESGEFLMKSVRLGTNHLLESVDNISEIYKREKHDLEAIDTQSGYRTIERFIKTKAAKADVRDFLVEQMKMPRRGAIADKNGNYTSSDLLGPISDDEAKFMLDVCNYLTEHGISFDVKLSRDKKLVAALGPRTEIRLLDRGDEQYQGRIYDQGVTIRLGTGSGGSMTAADMTNEDRMDMIRWYFGERILVDVSEWNKSEDYTDKYNSKVGTYVGEFATHFKSDNQGRGRKMPFATVAAASSRTADTSIFLKYKNIGGKRTTKIKDGKNVEVITGGHAETLNIMISPSAVSVKEDSDEVMFAESISKKGRYAIPLSKAVHPDDIKGTEGQLYISSSDPKRREYYAKVSARNELVRWLDSAKAAHAKAVDLDDIIDKFNITKTDGVKYEYEFSSDKGVAELQKLYWDILSGSVTELPDVINIVTEDNEDEEGELREAVTYTAVGESLDERIEAIRNHYARYQSEAFGSVPDFDMDGIIGEPEGFSPEMMARYVNTENSNGVQKNYTFIKHMLKTVGPEYAQSFIKGDSYVAKTMKNDMIAFDSEHIVARFNLFRDVIKNGSIHGNPDDLNRAMSDIEGLRDKPVTRDMMLHTAMALVQSGCAISTISIAIDENGIMSYEAQQCIKKTSAFTYEEVLSARKRAKEAKKTLKAIDEDVESGKKTAKEVKDAREAAEKIIEDFEKKDSAWRPIRGTIGQIFEPDQYGAIRPKYAVPSGTVLIPGYDAYLVDNDPENPTPMRDRLRLLGWETLMKQEITKCIHKAAFTIPAEYDFLPHTTDLNVVYRRAYDYPLPEDEYLENIPKDPAHPTPEEETYLNRIRTLSGRCRFPNEYGEGATTTAQAMLEHPDRDEAKAFDYYYSDLCDNNNLRVLSEEFDGIFDADMTGTAKTQGIVRYLVEGARVDSSTGKPIPVEYTNEKLPRCPLMNDVLFRNKDHDSWDRRQMAASQLLTALHTPRHVGAAMMNVKGWNFDDGFIITKKFAEQYAIKDVNGNPRPLMVQDKLSDLHGNKGVISLVIDPDMATDEIIKRVAINRLVDKSGKVFGDKDLVETDVMLDGKSYHVKFDPKSKESQQVQAAHQIQEALGMQGLDDIMKIFKDNPDLDVIMSPYSGMSRANGGSIKSLMEEPQDLILNGKTIKGGMGYTDMIVVDMPSDVKTHFYPEGAVMDGKGRKASGQLAWALLDHKCYNIMREMFGGNQSALDNYREYAITVGLDINESAGLEVGYHPQESRNEHRNLIKLPTEDLEISSRKISDKANKSKALKGIRVDQGQLSRLSEDMMAALNTSGGFMELPFQLDFKTLSYIKGFPQNKEVNPEMFLLQPTGQTYTVDGVEKPTYGMPVLPQGLRSGQDFIDGTSRPHDYTMHYMNVYKNALLYMACEQKIAQLKNGEIKCDAERGIDESTLTELMEKCKKNAQSEFDAVVRDVVEHRFDTKHNEIRDSIMANRLNHSATAVWSADPRLKLDEVAMSSEHAKMLGLCDENGKLLPNAEVLLWRDPVLKEGNIRCMKVKIREDINGVAVNPLIDRMFDGDFDGDSVGICALTTKEAKDEAHAAFGMDSNMLCPGVKDLETGEHPLYLQEGLDIASNAYVNPEINAKHDEIVHKMNELNKMLEEVENGTRKLDSITAERPKKLKDKSNHLVRDEHGNPIYATKIDENGNEVVECETVYGKPAVAYLRHQYMDELNEWATMALDGIGTDIIRFEDERSVVESFQHIVDDGAKGSQSKMRGLMDNIGIDYELGEDGRADLSTVKRIENEQGEMIPRNVAEGINRKVDKDIQATAAYKADNTALGGMSAQACVAAFRDYDLRAALELTYPITQAILQSKHDPQDAKVKDEIVRFWGKDIWDGYKLTGDFTLDSPEAIQQQAHNRVTAVVKGPDGKPIPRTERVAKYAADGSPLLDEKGNQQYEYRPVLNKNGEPEYECAYVRCTKEEWITQMQGMMRALKVDVNYDYIERLADIMIRDEPTTLTSAYTGRPITAYVDGSVVKVEGNKGRVSGVTDFSKEKGSLLDNLAYTGKFTTMVNEATKPVNERLSAGCLFSNVIAASFKLAEAKDAYREAKAAEDKARESNDKKELAEARKRKKAASEALDEAKRGFSESSMFAPKPFVNEILADAERAERQKKQAEDEAKGVKLSETDKDNAKKNRRTKKSKDESNLNGVTVTYVDPKPIGRKDCRLKADDLKRGCAFMGESQKDYEERLSKLRNQAEASHDETGYGSAGQQAKTMQTTTPTASASVPSSSGSSSNTRDAEQMGLDVPKHGTGSDGNPFNFGG